MVRDNYAKNKESQAGAFLNMSIDSCVKSGVAFVDGALGSEVYVQTYKVLLQKPRSTLDFIKQPDGFLDSEAIVQLQALLGITEPIEAGPAQTRSLLDILQVRIAFFFYARAHGLI